ncbi:phospholipase D-like domain-containing protein [Marinicella sp. W31]|uniref:phospholipase D-like domain-containing protein n=1 Tax=Marinicella sp. W31 TaxID=3023713 RepID=UPI00375784AD
MVSFPNNTLWWFLLHFLLAVISSTHALTRKRDPRSSMAWITVCLLLPIAGSFLYFLFGINRIEKRAHKIGVYANQFDLQKIPDALLNAGFEHLICNHEKLQLRPLKAGNSVIPLRDGTQAYPAMLNAITTAQISIVLSSYIFDDDETGKQFVEAMAKAQDRGVAVYVLIDGIGVFYSFPRITRLLKKNEICYVKFLPLKLFPPSIYLNLRNHRKILVVDQKIAFTGGMNIGNRHLPDGEGKLVSDLHFQLQGPIVTDLYDLFWQDWTFACGETRPKITHPPITQVHDHFCRLISDGPAVDFYKLSLLLHSVISAAQSSVLIVTPYFIPSREMVAVLLAAAHRGVRITILLPEKSNLRYIDWATRNLLWELLQWDVEIRYQPPPFDHSKLIIIDDQYVQIGSANIDPRSLRLNFELMVEIFNKEFATQMLQSIEKKIVQSRQITFNEIEARPLWIRVRDSLAWLMSPYL